MSSLDHASQGLLQDSQVVGIVVHQLVVLDGTAFVGDIRVVLQQGGAPGEEVLHQIGSELGRHTHICLVRWYFLVLVILVYIFFSIGA